MKTDAALIYFGGDCKFLISQEQRLNTTERNMFHYSNYVQNWKFHILQSYISIIKQKILKKRLPQQENFKTGMRSWFYGAKNISL